MKRLETLRHTALGKGGIDGFLITNMVNQLYFAGFPGTACILIPKRGSSTIYVYSVNYEQAKAEAVGFEVELVKIGEDLAATIARKVKKSKIHRLCLDAIAGVSGVADHLKLRKAMRGIAKIKIDSKPVSELRKVKDGGELELMRKAGKLTNEGMKTAFESINQGLKEYEVAAEIEYAMRKKGSCGTAFETIVASGVRSAFPHGGCTDRKIKKGDLVVVDIGATYQFYRSDMTRTFVTGKPSKKQKRIYEIVQKAQDQAIKGVKPNVKTKDIDAIARKTIEDAGYGKYFVHGLGHGVGLEVHEPPTLNRQSKDRLKVGNAVTIEPGIYIMDFGGIRIEDTVTVQKRKAEKLTDGFYTLETG